MQNYIQIMTKSINSNVDTGEGIVDDAGISVHHKAGLLNGTLDWST